MSEQEKKPVIGWVRVRRTNDGKRAFFPISFSLPDGKTFKGVLNMNKEKLNAVLESGEGLGETVVGTIALDTFVPNAKGGAATTTAAKKPAAKAAASDESPF